jgi:Villin headpiece domain
VIYLSQNLSEAQDLVKRSQQRVSELESTLSSTTSDQDEDARGKLEFVRQQTRYLQTIFREQEMHLNALELACLAAVVSDPVTPRLAPQEPAEQEEPLDQPAQLDPRRAPPTQQYSYATLLFQPPPDLNTSRRETYLTDAEFEVVFQMTREKFAQLPEWRRHEAKRQVHLF